MNSKIIQEKTTALINEWIRLVNKPFHEKEDMVRLVVVQGKIEALWKIVGS